MCMVNIKADITVRNALKGRSLDVLSFGLILTLFVLTLVSSIMTLMVIACDRFFGIVFAMKAHVTEKKSHVVIVFIWICAILISSPLFFYRKQDTQQWLDYVEIWCADDWPIDEPWRKTLYFTFVCLVLFVIPILVMTVAYSMIIYKLWSSRPPGESVATVAQFQVKKKVVIMLVIVLLSFTICWLPFQIAILYNEYRADKTQPLPEWYDKFYFIANYMGLANSAFNPIIYTGFNENFRKGFRNAMIFRKKLSNNDKEYTKVSTSNKDDSVRAFPVRLETTTRGTACDRETCLYS